MSEICAWCKRRAMPGQRVVDREDRVFCSPICEAAHRYDPYRGATLDAEDLA